MFEEAIAFFLGFFSIFSPCVLPLIPVIMGASRMKLLDTVAIFFGIVLSFLMLSMISFILMPFKILGYFLLFFLAFYLLEERFELFFSRQMAKFGLIAKLKLPPFLYGLIIPFLWLPCITPFLGLAISEAVIAEKPISISIFYIIGISSAMILIMAFGKKMKLDFSKLRKPLGFCVFASAIYLTFLR